MALRSNSFWRWDSNEQMILLKQKLSVSLQADEQQTQNLIVYEIMFQRSSNFCIQNHCVPIPRVHLFTQHETSLLSYVVVQIFKICKTGYNTAVLSHDIKCMSGELLGPSKNICLWKKYFEIVPWKDLGRWMVGVKHVISLISCFEITQVTQLTQCVFFNVLLVFTEVYLKTIYLNATCTPMPKS